MLIRVLSASVTAFVLAAILALTLITTVDAQRRTASKSKAEGGTKEEAAEGERAGGGIVGSWRIDLGEVVAVYTFEEDGSFRLHFSGHGGGSAEGTWTLEGDRLVMKNTRSRTAFTVAGETETAEVVSATEAALTLRAVGEDGELGEAFVLKSTDPVAARGRPHKHDDDRVVGSWRNTTGDLYIILSEDGTAVVSYAGRKTAVGDWDQAEKQLTLRLPTDDAGRGPDRGRAEAPGDEAQGEDESVEEAGFTIVTLDDVTMTLQLLEGGEEWTELMIRIGADPGAEAAVEFFQRGFRGEGSDPPWARREPRDEGMKKREKVTEKRTSYDKGEKEYPTKTVEGDRKYETKTTETKETTEKAETKKAVDRTQEKESDE